MYSASGRGRISSTVFSNSAVMPQEMRVYCASGFPLLFIKTNHLVHFTYSIKCINLLYYFWWFQLEGGMRGRFFVGDSGNTSLMDCKVKRGRKVAVGRGLGRREC